MSRHWVFAWSRRSAVATSFGSAEEALAEARAARPSFALVYVLKDWEVVEVLTGRVPLLTGDLIRAIRQLRERP